MYFNSSQFDKIPKRYSYIQDFNDFKELREYIEEIGDVELAQAIKLLGDFQGIEISKIQNLAESLYANRKAKNTITNAHQSKGLEFDEVVLGGDFFDFNDMWQEVQILKNMEAISVENEAILSEITLRLRNKIKQKIKTLQAELNILYVAITRAKKRLIDKSSNAELYIECNDWYYSDVLVL